MRKRNIK